MSDQPPQALVRPNRWHFPVIWAVPLAAALVSGYLLFAQFHELGPMISLHFEDGSGLKAGQTEIRYRGVQVGQVKAVELDEERHQVVVKARLDRSAAFLARTGSRFWVVRIQGGLDNLAGLGTVISGPYIEALPGTGEPQHEFTGMARVPAATGEAGLRIVLTARQFGSLWPNSPVYYRGVTVGVVQEGRLGNDARSVDIPVLIEPRYAPLVRKGSRFWRVGGVKVDFGLFRGLKINVGSLRSLVTGGIAFASPSGASAAGEGARFPLHEGPNPAWQAWSPRIALEPVEASAKPARLAADGQQ